MKSRLFSKSIQYNLYMKYLLLSFLLLFASCAQVKYSATKSKNFDNVKIETTYVVFANNNFRKRLKITSIDENFVNAIDSKGNSYQLKKDEIQKIRKNNTGGTVASIYAGSALAGGIIVIGIISRSLTSGFSDNEN